MDTQNQFGRGRLLVARGSLLVSAASAVLLTLLPLQAMLDVGVFRHAMVRIARAALWLAILGACTAPAATRVFVGSR